MKIGVSIDDELLGQIDAYAKANYLSRSGFLGLAAKSYLDAKEGMKSVASVTRLMEELLRSTIAKGSVDPSAVSELEGQLKLLDALKMK